MAAPVVLITGTSSGIGLATAVAAAAKGFTVVATMRDPSRSDALTSAAEAAGVELDIRALDVTDAEAAASVVSGVVADHGRLDMLVNNAGVGHVGTIELDDIAEYRSAMEVNFFGVVALTKLALPHLRASRGRLITVTSVGGVVGQPFNEAYCAAKFAAEGFLESLAPVAASVGVNVVIVEPGAVATEFAGNAGVDAALALAAGTDYAPAIDAYVNRTLAQFSPDTAQTPAGVADAIVAAMSVDSPAIRIQTSDSARAFAGAKIADLDGSRVSGITSGWIATD